MDPVQRLTLAAARAAAVGDNGDSSGSGGSRTGGSNGGGTANSSCEAICGGTCLFGGIAPGIGFDQCVAECTGSELDDDCGAEMTAYLNCLTGNNCNLAAFDCLSQAQAWTDCNTPPM